MALFHLVPLHTNHQLEAEEVRQRTMAQRSHVPKFGNWDGDNVPYTVYFDNARKEKSNGVMINPNDPQQNPGAFNIGGSISTDPDQVRMIPQKPVATNNRVHHRNTPDQQKGASYNGHGHVDSDQSSSEKNSSSSMSSIFKPNHQRKWSDRNKHASDSNAFPPPGPGHHKMNSDDISYRSVSVPKFGEWDEKDPRSAEGFTVIFNKVKEEKHIAASKFPPVPPHSHQPMDNNQTSQKKKTRSKRCCGLF